MHLDQPEYGLFLIVTPSLGVYRPNQSIFVPNLWRSLFENPIKISEISGSTWVIFSRKCVFSDSTRATSYWMTKFSIIWCLLLLAIQTWSCAGWQNSSNCKFQVHHISKCGIWRKNNHECDQISGNSSKEWTSIDLLWHARRMMWSLTHNYWEQVVCTSWCVPERWYTIACDNSRS